MKSGGWPRASRCLAAVFASILGLSLCASASAQDLRKWVNETQLTGDWGGARTKLEQSGVTIAFQYWTNLAGNPVGGREQGFTYTDSLNLSIDLDFEKLVSWKGGGFHFTFTNRDGSSLSQNDIGNIFTVQQIYGPTETYRLTEMTLDPAVRSTRKESPSRGPTSPDPGKPTRWSSSGTTGSR